MVIIKLSNSYLHIKCWVLFHFAGANLAKQTMAKFGLTDMKWPQLIENMVVKKLPAGFFFGHSFLATLSLAPLKLKSTIFIILSENNKTNTVSIYLYAFIAVLFIIGLVSNAFELYNGLLMMVQNLSWRKILETFCLLISNYSQITRTTHGL